MVSSSENSKSPFRGLECLRPFKKGERCVAVATDLLYRAVTPPCRSYGYTALFWLDSAQCPHPIPGKRSPERLKLRCTASSASCGAIPS